MTKKPSEKNKAWEKERRDRLNKSFDSLAKLLPNYDPTVVWTKIEIIQKSILYIDVLQKRNDKYLSNKGAKGGVNKNDDVHENLKYFQSRNKQLAELLKKAKIALPPLDIPSQLCDNQEIFCNTENEENLSSDSTKVIPTTDKNAQNQVEVKKNLVKPVKKTKQTKVVPKNKNKLDRTKTISVKTVLVGSLKNPEAQNDAPPTTTSIPLPITIQPVIQTSQIISLPRDVPLKPLMPCKAMPIPVPFPTILPALIKIENLPANKNLKKHKQINKRFTTTLAKDQNGKVKILPQPHLKLYYRRSDGKMPIPVLRKKIIVPIKRRRQKKRKLIDKIDTPETKKVKLDNSDCDTTTVTESANLDIKTVEIKANCKEIPDNENKTSSKLLMLTADENFRTISPTAAFLQSFPVVSCSNTSKLGEPIPCSDEIDIIPKVPTKIHESAAENLENLNNFFDTKEYNNYCFDKVEKFVENICDDVTRDKSTKPCPEIINTTKELPEKTCSKKNIEIVENVKIETTNLLSLDNENLISNPNKMNSEKLNSFTASKPCVSSTPTVPEFSKNSVTNLNSTELFLASSIPSISSYNSDSLKLIPSSVLPTLKDSPISTSTTTAFTNFSIISNSIIRKPYVKNSSSTFNLSTQGPICTPLPLDTKHSLESQYPKYQSLSNFEIKSSKQICSANQITPIKTEIITPFPAITNCTRPPNSISKPIVQSGYNSLSNFGPNTSIVNNNQNPNITAFNKTQNTLYPDTSLTEKHNIFVSDYNNYNTHHLHNKSMTSTFYSNPNSRMAASFPHFDNYNLHSKAIPTDLNRVNNKPQSIYSSEVVTTCTATTPGTNSCKIAPLSVPTNPNSVAVSVSNSIAIPKQKNLSKNKCKLIPYNPPSSVSNISSSISNITAPNYSTIYQPIGSNLAATTAVISKSNVMSVNSNYEIPKAPIAEIPTTSSATFTDLNINTTAIANYSLAVTNPTYSKLKSISASSALHKNEIQNSTSSTFTPYTVSCNTLSKYSNAITPQNSCAKYSMYSTQFDNADAAKNFPEKIPKIQSVPVVHDSTYSGDIANSNPPSSAMVTYTCSNSIINSKISDFEKYPLTNFDMSYTNPKTTHHKMYENENENEKVVPNKPPTNSTSQLLLRPYDLPSNPNKTNKITSNNFLPPLLNTTNNMIHTSAANEAYLAPNYAFSTCPLTSNYSNSTFSCLSSSHSSSTVPTNSVYSKTPQGYYYPHNSEPSTTFSFSLTTTNPTTLSLGTSEIQSNPMVFPNMKSEIPWMPATTNSHLQTTPAVTASNYKTSFTFSLTPTSTAITTVKSTQSQLSQSVPTGNNLKNIKLPLSSSYNSMTNFTFSLTYPKTTSPIQTTKTNLPTEIPYEKPLINPNYPSYNCSQFNSAKETTNFTFALTKPTNTISSVPAIQHNSNLTELNDSLGNIKNYDKEIQSAGEQFKVPKMKVNPKLNKIETPLIGGDLHGGFYDCEQKKSCQKVEQKTHVNWMTSSGNSLMSPLNVIPTNANNSNLDNVKKPTQYHPQDNDHYLSWSQNKFYDASTQNSIPSTTIPQYSNECLRYTEPMNKPGNLKYCNDNNVKNDKLLNFKTVSPSSITPNLNNTNNFFSVSQLVDQTTIPPPKNFNFQTNYEQPSEQSFHQKKVSPVKIRNHNRTTKDMKIQNTTTFISNATDYSEQHNEPKPLPISNNYSAEALISKKEKHRNFPLNCNSNSTDFYNTMDQLETPSIDQTNYHAPNYFYNYQSTNQNYMMQPTGPTTTDSEYLSGSSASAAASGGSGGGLGYPDEQYGKFTLNKIKKITPQSTYPTPIPQVPPPHPPTPIPTGNLLQYDTTNYGHYYGGHGSSTVPPATYQTNSWVKGFQQQSNPACVMPQYNHSQQILQGIGEHGLNLNSQTVPGNLTNFNLSSICPEINDKVVDASSNVW